MIKDKEEETEQTNKYPIITYNSNKTNNCILPNLNNKYAYLH